MAQLILTPPRSSPGPRPQWLGRRVACGGLCPDPSPRLAPAAARLGASAAAPSPAPQGRGRTVGAGAGGSRPRCDGRGQDALDRGPTVLDGRELRLRMLREHWGGMSPDLIDAGGGCV